MHGDVDGGVIGVGKDGALVEGEVGVGVAQHQSWDAAALEFLAQAAGQGDRDVFFEQRVAESLAVIVAAVAGVNDGKIAARGRRHGRRIGGGLRGGLPGNRRGSGRGWSWHFARLYSAGADVDEIVTVRPSLLKVAITGIEAFTVTTAAPLLSL